MWEYGLEGVGLAQGWVHDMYLCACVCVCLNEWAGCICSVESKMVQGAGDRIQNGSSGACRIQNGSSGASFPQVSVRSLPQSVFYYCPSSLSAHVPCISYVTVLSLPASFFSISDVFKRSFVGKTNRCLNSQIMTPPLSPSLFFRFSSLSDFPVFSLVTSGM